VFTWLQRYRGMPFGEACRYLGSTAQWQPAQPKRQQHEEVTGEPPDAEWQQKARRIVEIAEAQLWSSSGTRALAYLEGRGLGHAVIREARLGYIPGQYTEGQMLEGIWVWAGITIPWSE
jgi:DNA primase